MYDVLNMIPIPWEERDAVAQSGEYTIERVRTQWDYELEGFMLAHCLGTKNAETFGKHHRVFSVREKGSGIPHATVLCVRRGARSPYGACADLGTKGHMRFEGRKLRVLQVRGRFDALARPEYLQLVFQWFQSLGGKPRISLNTMLHHAVKYGDDDDYYHFENWMDERNDFTYSHRYVEAVQAARKAGTSL
jgi:hypothetical protein